MNTFKRKALFTAVVAGFGTIGTAEAVFQSPLGTGQALLFPYYTVQSTGSNSWNTYLSIVNTTPDAKAVKVRILEGRTSNEVLDFNLFLSANDVWTAAIVPVDATASSGGKIITADVSCTAPAIGPSGEPFRNYSYVGQAAALGRGLDRTREGYVEMIEMGSLTLATAAAVTHNSAGTPANCAAVRVASYATINGTDVFQPTGGLSGTGTLINVNSGLDAGYKADALEAFSDVPSNITPTGFTTPNMAQTTPPVGIVFNNGYDPISSSHLTVYAADYAAMAAPTDGAMATASVYMHSSVLNEYVLDTATGSLTDWVITQPIKNFFVSTTTAWAPYTQLLTTSGACEEVEFTYFNREEKSATAGGIDFSPPPPNGPASSICWESTVLSIRNGADHMPTGDASGVLGSVNATSIKITPTFQNGWARLRFTDLNASATGLVSAATSTWVFSMDNGPLTAGAGGAVQMLGLPATGFMIRTFSNGTLTCGSASCQGNYASLFNHSYGNTIAP
jgi:hypothetical protein